MASADKTDEEKLNFMTTAVDTKQACPICYQTLTERTVRGTVCGHIFCKACIARVWRESDAGP